MTKNKKQTSKVSKGKTKKVFNSDQLDLIEEIINSLQVSLENALEITSEDKILEIYEKRFPVLNKIMNDSEEMIVDLEIILTEHNRKVA